MFVASLRQINTPAPTPALSVAYSPLLLCRQPKTKAPRRVLTTVVPADNVQDTDHAGPFTYPSLVVASTRHSASRARHRVAVARARASAFPW